MADQFVGEIRMFAGDFAPTGWAFCDGAILPISQNTALFSLLGTMYGGDGRSTFALPNLMGRHPLHVGNSTGPGLSQHVQGEQEGADAVTITGAQLPSHTHIAQAVPAATTAVPGASTFLAPTGNGHAAYHAASNHVRMADETLLKAGGSQPHDNLQPYLSLSFIIALQGIFPSRG